MDNKKIPTWLGTVIIIIFAATVGAFVWKYEEDNMKIQTQTLQTNQKDNTQTSRYANKMFGFGFKYPSRLIVTSKSNDNNTILSDKPEGHWVFSINTVANPNNFSLENAFNQILTENTKSVVSEKSINITSITIGGRPAKKYSIKNYTDYGNTGIVLIDGKNIISIFGDDSIPLINSDFQSILNSFNFTN